MSKRSASPDFTENPSIKRRGKDWQVTFQSLRSSSISPPPRRASKSVNTHEAPQRPKTQEISTAEVEAGKAQVRDHLAYFAERLENAALRLSPSSGPRLRIDDFVALYRRNLHPHGRHFVVHQHDHPITGTHYDLRLQCNATSSISFAIMYGLPGDANSRRLSRNAAETRVHNVWNHLIETASLTTGSMLIWDTGEYSILPHREDQSHDSSQDESDSNGIDPMVTTNRDSSEAEKLHRAFRSGKIRLRLQGTRLPKNYTISLRLSAKSYSSKTQPKAPARRRTRNARAKIKASEPQTSESEDSNPSLRPTARDTRSELQSLHRTATPPGQESEPVTAPSDDETEAIRLMNAYTGATNDIGSIHQRTWYITLDRLNSGFMAQTDRKTGRKVWVRKRLANRTMDGFDSFLVLGRDRERSVVTGRLASEVLKDEGVVGYVGRAMWRPVTE